MREDVIGQETLEVRGAEFKSISISIERPALMVDDEHDDGDDPERIYGCSYSIVAGSRVDKATIYGSGSLQALLFTLFHIADKVAALAAETGAIISPDAWQDLERLRTPPEVLLKEFEALRNKSD